VPRQYYGDEHETQDLNSRPRVCLQTVLCDGSRRNLAAFRLAAVKTRGAEIAIAAARVEPGTADMEERKRNKSWRITMKAVEWILRQLRSLSPYLAVELILPGGSIVALLLWTYRYRTGARPTAMRSREQNGQLRPCGIGRPLRSLSTNEDADIVG